MSPGGPAGRARGWLSKTDFVTGLACERATWYRRRSPEAAGPAPPGLALRLADGDAVDAFAQEAYPGGTLVGDRRFGDAVRATREAVAAGARRIYQATFVAPWGGCRVDVLDVGGDGAVVREVKASLGLKAAHVWDVAYQVAVLETCGVAVARALVVHLDPGVVGRGPRLLTEVDVTPQVRALLASELPEARRRLERVVAGSPPAAPRGQHCLGPSPCPFRADCWASVPEDGVEWLPGLSASRVAKLRGRGLRRIGDLPPRVRLPAVAAEYRRRLLAGPAVDAATVRAWSTALVRPAVSLATVWDRRPIPEGPDPAYAPRLVAFAAVEAGRLVARGVDEGDPMALGAALVAALRGEGSVVCAEAETLRARLQGATGPALPGPVAARLRGRLTDVRALAERGVMTAPLLVAPRLEVLAAAVVGGEPVPSADALVGAYRRGDAGSVGAGVEARARATDALVTWACAHPKGIATR